MSGSIVELKLKMSFAEADKLLRSLIKNPTTGILIFWSKGSLMADTITVRDNDPEFSCSVAYTDEEGNPTSPDNPPSWAVDDLNVADILTVSDDGLHAAFNPGHPGATQVQVTLRNNDGTTVLLTGAVNVVPGEAVRGALEFTPGDVSGGGVGS